MDFSGAIVFQDGEALPAKYSRIAEIIQDFDPNLELAWIPPGQQRTGL